MDKTNDKPAGDELVLIIDPMHQAGMDRIAASYPVIWPHQGLADPRLGDVTVLTIRTHALPHDLIDRMPKLRLISKHGSGVDNIPIPYCTEKGIMVANTPGGANSTAVAEGAVALMLAVLRQVLPMDAMVREDRWEERWDIRLGDLTGAKVGLIGFGRIARMTAKICGPGFGAEVSAYDPLVSAEDMAAAGVTKVELADILKSDVISIHVPLTPQTRKLIGAAELAQMHAGAVIVNTSRGGIIDEAALADALARRAIYGAGIDVLESEPPPADHPLFSLPNVVLGPHLAGVTEGSLKHMSFAVADIIDIVVRGETPATLLNPEVL